MVLQVNYLAPLLYYDTDSCQTSVSIGNHYLHRLWSVAYGRNSDHLSLSVVHVSSAPLS